VLRRLGAILQRNRRLPPGLQELALVPVLFDVAQHAQRTAPAIIFLGLLALRASTGNGKRKRPSS
jgi:hypothetical protein